MNKMVQLPLVTSAGLSNGAGTASPDISADAATDLKSLTQLPSVPANEGPPSIPLQILLDFAIQKVYHDLTVRAELVQNENDVTKKMGIIEFANSTRLLFIRLLALVKWLKSSSKVQTCTSIMYFLDQQCLYFVDTADKLSFLATEELSQARLSSFQIPSAVDVLTLGSYPRLPLCIKNRFVPTSNLTGREKICVLNRLNQVIRHRIMKTGAQLPPNVTDIAIANGMVRIVVSGEFSVCLTVMGETSDTPWTLLDVSILVEDLVIGDGMPLVHPLQLHFLHQCAQSRMNASSRPLLELYTVLHTFCIGLQLDVMYCQTMQLSHSTLGSECQVEEYVPGTRLVIGYWRRAPDVPNSTQSQHKLHISVSDECSLVVRHISYAPGLPSRNSIVRNPKLSIQQLITKTQIARALHRLQRISKTMERHFGQLTCRLTGENVPSVTVPVMVDGNVENADEWLTLSVSAYTGNVMCQLPVLINDKHSHFVSARKRLLTDLESALGSDRTDAALMNKLVLKLRTAVMVARCVDTCSVLPVQVVDRAQLLTAVKQKMSSSAGNNAEYVVLQFDRDTLFYLVVCVMCTANGCVSVDNLLLTTTQSRLPALGPGDRMATSVASSVVAVLALKDVKGLRSLTRQNADEEVVPKKRMRLEVLSELCANVGLIDEYITRLHLVKTLNALRVTHSLAVDNTVLINNYSMCKCLSKADEQRLVAKFTQTCIRRCAVRLRLHDKQRTCELSDTSVMNDGWSFGDRLLVTDCTCNSADKMHSAVREHVNTILQSARLHQLVVPLRYALLNGANKYFKVSAYDYKQLTVNYGPNGSFHVTVECVPSSGNDSQFRLTFGVERCCPAISNPHSMHTLYYEQMINKNAGQSADIVQLMYNLHSTCGLLAGLHSLLTESSS